MEIGRTSRGFALAQFYDLYGVDCSVQDSSLATEDAIWLGAHNNRMHLSRGMVEALIPMLEGFLVTGSIATPNPVEEGGV